MIIFADGKCTKCGGPTHGYGGPMKCSRCGHESEMPESLKRILDEMEDVTDTQSHSPGDSQVSCSAIGQAQQAR